MRGLVVAGAMSLACSNAALGQSQPTRAAQSQDIAGWIDQLGAATYSQREQATRQLLTCGLDGLPNLEKAFHSPDREVRVRARGIAQEILRRERPRRIASFLADEPLSSRFPLPGWKQLQRIAGDTPDSRKFLAELLIADWELLEPAESPNLPLQDVRERCHQLAQRARAGLSIDEQRGLAGILLGSLDDSGAAALDTTSIVRLYSLVRAHSLQGQRDPDSLWNNGVYQRIVSRFLVQTANPTTAQMALQIALQQGLPDLAELAQLNLEHPGMPATARQWSLLALGQHGSLEHLALIEPFLQDEQVCARRTVPGSDSDPVFECRVQDAALLALWALHERDAAELGFTSLSTNPRLGYLPQTVGFASDEQRQQALEKYRRFREQQGQRPTDRHMMSP